MVNLRIIKNTIGFSFKGLGFFWSISNRFLCNYLCSKGRCGGSEDSMCFFLLLFVAIIFFVCGYAIITMNPRKKKKLKKMVGIK